MIHLYNRSNVTTPAPKVQPTSAKPTAAPTAPPANQVALNTVNAPPPASTSKPTTSVTNHIQSSNSTNANGVIRQVTNGNLLSSTSIATSFLTSTEAVPKSIPSGKAELNGSTSTFSQSNNDNVPSTLQKGTSTALIIAIGLCGVVVVLLVLILAKLFINHRRKGSSGRNSLMDENTRRFPQATSGQPRNQEMGGVGASPSPVVYRSTSYSSIGSSMSIKKQEYQPFTAQDTSSTAHRGPHGYANLEGSHQSVVEYLQPMGASFTESRAWDGSRPSLSYDR